MTPLLICDDKYMCAILPPIFEEEVLGERRFARRSLFFFYEKKLIQRTIDP